jgi:hypothetical protein
LALSFFHGQMVGQPCDCVAPISIPVERLKTDRGEGPCNVSFIALSRIPAAAGSPRRKIPKVWWPSLLEDRPQSRPRHGRAHPLLAAAETAGSMLGSLAKALYPLPVLYRE